MVQNKNNTLTALDVLKEYWGYDSFRSIQEEVIESVLDGKDTVAIASTGTGKALHKDTIIQTPYGVTTMKYVKEGDYVLGRDLVPTKVIGKYQPMTPDHYLITFDCDTTVKCCGDHLWLIYNENGTENVVDTRTLFNNFKNTPITIKSNSKASNKDFHFIKDVVEIEDNPEDYYCISVDNTDKLYLITYKFIPTHNTVLYQIPAILKEGVTIVISPLKALQKDQIDALESKGIKASLLNSDVGIRARKKLQQDLVEKKIKILYVAPETLFSPTFTPFIPLLDVNFIAIDEAHCASQWSDFRPKYQQIHEVNKIFPKAVKLAVTATADDLVIKDIVTNTGIKSDYNIFKGSVDRSNIELNVFKQTKAPSRHVLDVVQSFSSDEQGIVYCSSRKDTENLANFLNALGYKSIAYHAALKKSLKDKAQEDFINKDIKIMCATIAFGMGIDIPDIRYVIHTDAPDSFESYQQQIGRASRIGNKAYAYLFYNPSSYATAYWLNKKSTKNPSRLLMKNKKLKAFYDFCAVKSCRRKVLLSVFGEDYSKNNCGSCDICLKRKSFK